jgi:4-diphosphocytidyl-2C-methyl-D-erythritol kinase
MATLHELQTVYGAQDLYDMLEINAVDNYNRNVRIAAGD